MGRQLFHQRDQIEEKLNIEPPERHTDRLVGARRSPISPFFGYGEAAALGIAQNERVDATYPSFLQYEEGLAFAWMKGMADLSPTQRGVARRCS